LGRSENAARRGNSPKTLTDIQKLQALSHKHREKFDKIRGAMIHEVNFVQTHVVGGRAWDWFIVQRRPFQPSESLLKIYERHGKSQRAMLRTEAGHVAQSFIVLYPDWRVVLGGISRTI
jgi:hypothetical protein